jgi:nucleotide-binding universal stress UspA family protein
MKKLIVPTDFSDISKNSIICSFKIASELNLKVNLIHVLELYKFAAGISETELISTILPVDNIQELEASAMVSFNKMMDELKPLLPSEVEFETKVISGNLVNEMIVESTKEETAMMTIAVASTQDLITRFTHNTISSILEDAACPVIMIPSGYNYKSFSNVVLATDFNKYDIDILQFFLSTFGKINPKITVLHVSSKPCDFKSELKLAGFKQIVNDKIPNNAIDFKMICNKNVTQGIMENLKILNADMLLMLKEHEGFFKSLFETSKTEKITHYLKIPMLSFHEIIPEKIKIKSKI